MAGTSHRPSKTCPSFSWMPLPQRTTRDMRSLQPLLLRDQQVRSKIQKTKTLLKSRWITTNQKYHQTTLLSLLCPQDTPEPAIKSANQQDFHMQRITAKPGPIWHLVPLRPPSISQPPSICINRRPTRWLS